PVDYLLGSKENLIAGQLVPVGSGGELLGTVDGKEYKCDKANFFTKNGKPGLVIIKTITSVLEKKCNECKQKNNKGGFSVEITGYVPANHRTEPIKKGANEVNEVKDKYGYKHLLTPTKTEEFSERTELNAKSGDATLVLTR
ncbi:21692_t:CDS:2, partial [Entrophospora sp. SA101]